jgi:hypothetical protein
MLRDLGLATLVLAILIVILAHGGCGGPDLVVGSTTRPTAFPTGVLCKAQGEFCAAPIDCCSQLCQAAQCSCLSRGSACSFDNTCCSGVCNATPGVFQNTCT